MLEAVTTIYNNIHKNLFSGLSLVDLQKAFETLYRQTLLIKLKHCGLSSSK